LYSFPVTFQAKGGVEESLEDEVDEVHEVDEVDEVDEVVPGPSEGADRADGAAEGEESAWPGRATGDEGAEQGTLHRAHTCWRSRRTRNFVVPYSPAGDDPRVQWVRRHCNLVDVSPPTEGAQLGYYDCRPLRGSGILP